MPVKTGTEPMCQNRHLGELGPSFVYLHAKFQVPITFTSRAISFPARPVKTPREPRLAGGFMVLINFFNPALGLRKFLEDFSCGV